MSIITRLKKLLFGDKEVEDKLPPNNTDNKIFIWDVLEGPYGREEFDEEELISAGIDDSLECFLVVKLQENGSIGQVNFWLETFEEAHDMIDYFKTNIEPLEVT